MEGFKSNEMDFKLNSTFLQEASVAKSLTKAHYGSQINF